jgi:SAM-dependent methyltransferase
MNLFRPGGLALTQKLVGWTDLPPGASILDIGCGSGAAVAFLRGLGFDARGVDANPERMACNSNSSLIVADAEDLPFGFEFNCEFDAALLECVLSVTRTERVLSECNRILPPNGWLLISDLYELEPEKPFSQKDWTQIIQAAGFTVIDFSDQTQALRDYAAQMIWNGTLGDCALHKPGYFALSARKLGRGFV